MKFYLQQNKYKNNIEAILDLFELRKKKTTYRGQNDIESINVIKYPQLTKLLWGKHRLTDNLLVCSAKDYHCTFN